MLLSRGTCNECSSRFNSTKINKWRERKKGKRVYGLWYLCWHKVIIQKKKKHIKLGHLLSYYPISFFFFFWKLLDILTFSGCRSLLTGLFPPSSGSIDVYGIDMQTNIDAIRKELGVCMQYDVLFDHMTTKEHLLLYGQIKAPHWSPRELHEQVRT